MNNKEIFLQTEELGNLYLYGILLFYIYPRVFVCEDKYGCKYLFYEMSSSENRDIWLISKITKVEYYNLVDGKNAIQDVYRERHDSELFSITKTYGEKDRIELKPDGKAWVNKLPAEDVYADESSITDSNEDTLKEARDSESTTFDIRLFAGTDRHSLPQNIMSNLCETVSSLISSISGNIRKTNQLRVSTAPGSCIVRFSFPDQTNLLSENDVTNEMQVINQVLSSESVSESLDTVKNPQKFIRSYSGLMKTIRKTNSSVQFTTAYPNSSGVNKISLTKTDITKRYEIISKLCTVQNEEKTIRGSLIALDTKNKKFKLQTQGEIISGTFNEELIDNSSYEIPKDYTASITIEEYIDKQNICNKKKYILNSLSEK